MKKIALLFLTRQDINQSALWKQLLKKVPDLFNVYVHSKKPLKDSFFQSKRIPEIVPTEYAYHVKAWQALHRVAFKNPDNYKFVSLSEACIPLYPLKEIYQHLISNDYSYMVYNRPWWEEESPREIVELPKEHRWGNVEWKVLNRKHTEIVVNDYEIIEIVSKHLHDHESYFATLFGVHNALKEVISRKTTLANFRNNSRPYEFKNFEPSDLLQIKLAKRSGCIFARKFSEDYPKNYIDKYIHLLLRPLKSKKNGFKSYQEELNSLEYQEELSLSNVCFFLPQLINESNYRIGCELGVYSGLHMERVLSESSIEEVYGIDPYESYEMPCLYEIIKDRFSVYSESGRAMIVKKKPSEAMLEFSEAALDYVYFSEPYQTIKDLNEWFGKVRIGGMFCGYSSVKEGVIIPKPIQEFFNNKGLKTQFNYLESGFWWVFNKK